MLAVSLALGSGDRSGAVCESQGNRHLPRRTLEKSNHMDQMKGEMEKQLKAEKRGAGRSMAFTLMPIYAVGVALFAAYKFSKVKSNEKNRSKLSKDDETKTKATENQLLELEKHLAHTEKMLNSLLTQLDPLSNCVNTLAAEQKDEIMNQLQSIRQLMKKSGMDKTTINNPGNQSSENTLEDLIDALNIQNPGISRGDENKPDEKDVDLPAHNFVSEEPVIHPGLSHCEEDSPQPEEDVAQSPTSDGLRKRNVKD
ncbi:coiled-coil domain-containing protein 107-like isoform X2 [Hyla sarda]|uniref:coiled-coil domain-containing protein 107-like isoform X2 n=1 Tax=Hyla sarda TaxID=327740 RepID=UPI0024C40702|nr:coiled-coil domain-containing protein 107-like isoform X2 [Hyla sarda]